MSQKGRHRLVFRIRGQVSDFDDIYGQQCFLINYYNLRMELEIKHSQDSNLKNASTSEFDENNETVDDHQLMELNGFISPNLLRKLPFICEAKGGSI